MRRMYLVCVAAGLLVAAAGCKSQKNEEAFVPPEPIPDSETQVAAIEPYSPPVRPEPLVRPVAPVPEVPAPGAADETFGSVGTYPNPPGGGVVPPPASPAGGPYTVRKGDTLYGLARRFYNDQRKWHLIYAANRTTLSDPNYIRVGQVLTIPAAE